MQRRPRRWIWIGRFVAVAILLGVGVWLWVVGLTQASAIGGAAGLLVAIAALFAPYVFPPSSPQEPGDTSVEDSGSASATNAGQANAGIQASAGADSVRVSRTGNATADGAGSVANTGVQDSAP